MGKASSLWPFHPKPLPDELMSSWLVRIAHGHGMKLQTFCRVSLGKGQELWNRDIDRQAPDWLVRALSEHTGVGLREIRQSTLLAYKGLLYRDFRLSGQQSWLLPLGLLNVKRLHYGVQFCPLCLAEDETPYFRKRWRLAFYTMCTKHQCMVHDRCPSCGAPVAFHRREMGKFSVVDGGLLALCHACDFDLRKAPAKEPVIYDESAFQAWLPALKLVEGKEDVGGHYDLGFFAVAHQLGKIMLTHYSHAHLREYVSEIIKAPGISLHQKREPLEHYSMGERHVLMQLVMWLLADPANRIVKAWRNKAMRYNVMRKDLCLTPFWYENIVKQCNN